MFISGRGQQNGLKPKHLLPPARYHDSRDAHAPLRPCDESCSFAILSWGADYKAEDTLQ